MEKATEKPTEKAPELRETKGRGTRLKAVHRIEGILDSEGKSKPIEPGGVFWLSDEKEVERLVRIGAAAEAQEG